jgi:hypothetical protein
MNDAADTPALRADPTRSTTLATSQATRWLALGAIVGPIVFMLAWLVLGELRPGYSPVRQQISELALGPNGVLMGGAFVLGGLLVLAGVVGFFRATRAEVGPRHAGAARPCWRCRRSGRSSPASST